MSIIGTRSGRLVAVAVTPGLSPKGTPMIACRCDCGEFSLVRICFIKSGHTKSCGCRKRCFGRHCHTAGRRNSPEFTAWQSMRERCTDPTYRHWHRYGGRGIGVCERWLGSFDSFLADMGPRPSPAHSLDRINNDGNYEPGNCRWATQAEQQQNRGNNKLDWPTVREIRGRAEHGEAKASIARRMGVSQTMIGYVVSGRKWKETGE